jgi:hypothetical protein
MEGQTTYIHNGKGTVRAYVYGRLDLLDFAKQVFDVVELERNKLPNGFHVQAQIGDSVIVLSATDPPYKEQPRHRFMCMSKMLTRLINARWQRGRLR